jgi:hypothetical protein
MKINEQYVTSVRCLLICGAGLLAFVLVGILPNQMAMRKIDQNIASLKGQLAEQESLFPIYNELMRRIQKTPPNDQPLFVKEALSEADTQRPALDMQALAVEHRLRLESIRPDLDSLVNGTGSFRLKASVKGALPDFQPFLLKMGKLPYLEKIEMVRISASDAARELFVQFTVNQKS